MKKKNKIDSFWKPVPKKKKDLNYPQAKRKYPGLNPLGDYDKDGVINMKDCKPFNKKKQGWVHGLGWRATPEERRKGYKKLRDAGIAYPEAQRAKGWRPERIRQITSEPELATWVAKGRKRLEETGKSTPQHMLDYDKTPARRKTKREYQRPYQQKRREMIKEDMELNARYKDMQSRSNKKHWKKVVNNPELHEKNKEKMKEYYREYRKNPEVKEKEKEYYEEYSQRPEVKEKKAAYAREYRKKQKEKINEIAREVEEYEEE